VDFPEAKSGCQWYNVGPTNDENVGLLKAHEYYSWLVVSNMSYFPFHIWHVILPIDELIFFKMVTVKHVKTTKQIVIRCYKYCIINCFPTVLAEVSFYPAFDPPISSAVKLLPANRGAFDRWNIPNVACYDACGGLVLSKMWIFQVYLGWFPADWWLDMTSRSSKKHWPGCACWRSSSCCCCFFWLDCSWLFQSLGHNGFQHFQVCIDAWR